MGFNIDGSSRNTFPDSPGAKATSSTDDGLDFGRTTRRWCASIIAAAAAACRSSGRRNIIGALAKEKYGHSQQHILAHRMRELSPS